MSDVREPGTDEMSDPESRPRVRWSRARVAVVAVSGLVLASMGYAIGARTPWTAHHPDDQSGTAERVAANVPLAYFDPDGGERVSFRPDNVVWKSGERTGSGSIPPCLREIGARVTVNVGVIEVTRPYGSGSYGKVLSLTCPTE